jgi:hypothetical protein
MSGRPSEPAETLSLVAAFAPPAHVRNMAISSTTLGVMKRGKQTETTERIALELRLADGTPAEAFGRLAAAIDDGRVTIAEGKLLADILERRLRILDAEEFRRRLEMAEARALESARRSPALPAPAARATVEVPPEAR